jgi:8-oxo-dGTP pyrophosphatase MutT (NUDIX family)
MVLVIAARFFVRADGCTLLVRKPDTTTFTQPGGRINPDETVKQALVRELGEELGLSVSVGSLDISGTLFGSCRQRARRDRRGGIVHGRERSGRKPRRGD